MSEWSQIRRYNPLGPDYPEAGRDYVLRSEAEEQIAELGAEVAEWREKYNNEHADRVAAEAKNERWQAEMDVANKKILKMHQKLRAVGDALTDHIADLRRTADVLTAWQDPNVGPFDATIRELHKAANELDALLK